MFAMIITKAVNKGMAGVFLLFLLILSCVQADPDDIERDRRIRQREQTKASVRTTGSQEIYGQYSSSDYEGDSCVDAEEDKRKIGKEDCEDVCIRLFDQESNRCERLALELIEKLAKLFENMSHLNNEEDLSRSVNSFDFGVMIDIHVQPVLTLIDNWNVRETTEFLIWTAKTPAVTLALKEHDREHEILKDAFEKVSDSTVEAGLAKDLRGFGKTFWNLAQGERNKSAFIVVHNLLQKICLNDPNSRKNCKTKHYCTREEYEDNRRRRTICPYANDRRSFRRLEHCYIHGPNVWNYWLSLNRDREFKDSDFPPNTKMNETVCNELCKTESCART